MKTCVRMQGVNGCFRGCMEATVREPPRCFAVFELQPPWGDRTNHGGGWVVGETRVRGLYSRSAANGTPRAAQKATSFRLVSKGSRATDDDRQLEER